MGRNSLRRTPDALLVTFEPVVIGAGLPGRCCHLQTAEGLVVMERLENLEMNRGRDLICADGKNQGIIKDYQHPFGNT